MNTTPDRTLSSPGRLPRGGDGLRIGITVGLRDRAESMWINGIKQNALYLARLFQHSPRGHRVTLVNTTDVVLDGALPWDREAFPTCGFSGVQDDLDVLIELGGQISAEQTDYLKRRGTRLVSYCCGPEYVQGMEAMIFGRGDGGVFINRRYDEIWVIPQIVETSEHFFSALRRRPVRHVPFVWDPMCLEARTRHLPDGGQYRPRPGAGRRLTVMEPNHDVLKFCLYPMLVADTAYRRLGERIAALQVTNADQLASRSPTFVALANSLDLVRDSRAFFVGRYETPQFLADHTDIVISHQWGLALNYFYFDVCWLGYPLVHNASLCAQLGYYYAGNDVEQGAQRVVEAVQHHDGQWQAYAERQRRLITPFLSTHAPLVAEYDGLLDALLAAAPAA